MFEATPRQDPHDLLRGAVARYGVEPLARDLDVSQRTLGRWMDGSDIQFGQMLVLALTQIEAVSSISEVGADFTFSDLFAGIGGTRLGFEANRGSCVFTSEYDKHCQKTYRENFGHRNPKGHKMVSDLREVTCLDDSAIDAAVPDHDVLVGGFPCQPFSVAGVSKKRSLGQADGFACDAQGTLFFDLARVIKVKRPRAFLLENVKNLRSHDRGRTVRVIMDTLEHDLGYSVYPMVLNARPWVPQHRERIYLVGFSEPVNFDWQSVARPVGADPTLASILHPEDGTETADGKFTLGTRAAVADKYTLSKHLWEYLQGYAAKHRARGNGFGFGLVGPDDTARTLSARYYKDGSEILIKRGKRGTARPRRLTPRECARLMGFDDSFQIPVSDTQAYKQFGNSVAVPVISSIAQAMHPFIMQLKNEKPSGVMQLAM